MGKQPSIFVHPRVFYTGRFGGVSRYVCELTEELIKLGSKVYIPIRNTPNEYLKKAPFYKQVINCIPVSNFFIRCSKRILQVTPLRNIANKIFRRLEGVLFAKKGEYDIVHPSHTYATEILPYIKDKPLVVTIHDMIDEIYFCKDSAQHRITSARKKAFALQANKIIAISENTKKDLVRLFNIPEDKVAVIYHGNSLKLPNHKVSIEPPLPEKYILYVGLRSHYKNFIVLANAFALIAEKYPELKLICAGGGSFTDEETEILKKLNIAEKIEQRSITDEELATMYNRSQCFVYPSKYEGFGLPLLEAFECGAPVICSSASCFPEIAGDAALYFEAENVEDLLRQLTTIIEEPAIREKLKIAGKERVKLFTWDKTAAQTMEVYKEAIIDKTISTNI